MTQLALPPLSAVWDAAPDAKAVSSAPKWLQTAVTLLSQYLAGYPTDLAVIPVDLSGSTPFAQQIYRAAQRIPRGSTITYGELAEQVGNTSAARAVGQALGANPIPLIIPCHRIVAARGALGGFSAPGGTATKQQLIALERDV